MIMFLDLIAIFCFVEITIIAVCWFYFINLPSLSVSKTAQPCLHWKLIRNKEQTEIPSCLSNEWSNKELSALANESEGLLNEGREEETFVSQLIKRIQSSQARKVNKTIFTTFFITRILTLRYNLRECLKCVNKICYVPNFIIPTCQFLHSTFMFQNYFFLRSSRLVRISIKIQF